jgi:hypothetical protein
MFFGDRLDVLSFNELAGVPENLDRLSGVSVLLCSDSCSERNHIAGKDIVGRNWISKSLEGYTQNTRNVAALKRTRDQDLAIRDRTTITRELNGTREADLNNFGALTQE